MYFGTIFLPGRFPIVNLERVMHYLSEYYGLGLKVQIIRNEDDDVEVDIGAEEYYRREFYVGGKTIETRVFHDMREDGKGYVFRVSDLPETIIKMKDNDGFYFE